MVTASILHLDVLWLERNRRVLVTALGAHIVERALQRLERLCHLPPLDHFAVQQA